MMEQGTRITMSGAGPQESQANRTSTTPQEPTDVPMLITAWAGNQGAYLWPRHLILYIQISGHLIDKQSRQMYGDALD